MTLRLNPDGPDLDDTAKAGEVVSDSCWNGQWTSDSPEDDEAARTQQSLSRIARARRNGNSAQG